MTSRAVTFSLREALYLLGRANRVVRVRTESTWPYGLEECTIEFEGETAEADHRLYVARNPVVNLQQLPKLFSAITAALEKAGEP